MVNSAAYISNDNYEPVNGSGTVGQLFVSSPNLASGYCGGNGDVRGFITTEVNDSIDTFSYCNLKSMKATLRNITFS